MSERLFDLQRFLQSLAGDEELARELLSAFMEDSPVRTASLGEALDSDDASTASKLAHSLKGMCGVVRAEALVNLAYMMETSAKIDNLDKTREQYAKFAELLVSAHAEMQTYVDAA